MHRCPRPCKLISPKLRQQQGSDQLPCGDLTHYTIRVHDGCMTTIDNHWQPSWDRPLCYSNAAVHNAVPRNAVALNAIALNDIVPNAVVRNAIVLNTIVRNAVALNDVAIVLHAMPLYSIMSTAKDNLWYTCIECIEYRIKQRTHLYSSVMHGDVLHMQMTIIKSRQSINSSHDRFVIDLVKIPCYESKCTRVATRNGDPLLLRMIDHLGSGTSLIYADQCKTWNPLLTIFVVLVSPDQRLCWLWTPTIGVTCILDPGHLWSMLTNAKQRLHSTRQVLKWAVRQAGCQRMRSRRGNSTHLNQKHRQENNLAQHPLNWVTPLALACKLAHEALTHQFRVSPSW